MPHNRYYIDHPLNLFDNVTFEEAEFNHMVKVMRVCLNEEIEIINGNGTLAKALIYSIENLKKALLLLKLF
jgi:16S rRNA U1498 N3-methylase RsmE